MPYALREFSCAGCGRPVRKRASPSAAVRCILCNVTKAAEASRQLHARSGPYYERWAAGMARAAAEAAVLVAIGQDIDGIRQPGERS